MNDCVVLRLNEKVTNENLPLFGKIKLNVTNKNAQTARANHFAIKMSSPATLVVDGNGYFTNDTFDANYGTEKKIDANLVTHVYVSSGVYNIICDNKYALLNLDFSLDGIASPISAPANVSVNISELYGIENFVTLRCGYGNLFGDISKIGNSTSMNSIQVSTTIVHGDVAGIKNLTDLTTLSLSDTDVSGDISAFSDMTSLTVLAANGTMLRGDISALQGMNPTSISLQNVSGIKGDIANLENMSNLTSLRLENTKVYGDISNLKNLTSLTSLLLENTNVYGDIENLKDLTALTSLTINYTLLSGDIENLKDLTNISTVFIKGINNLTGDISKLADAVYFISNQNGSSSFTWTSDRSQNAVFMALENIDLGETVDAMLNAQANLPFKDDVTSAWYKKLVISGTRSSASDSAVSTLKGRGVSIILNGNVI